MTKEQRQVLECVARYIWQGAQPHSVAGYRKMLFWRRRIDRAAIRMLNASCSSPSAPATRDVLRKMLASIGATP